MAIDAAITEIKTVMDGKLKSLQDPEDFSTDLDAAQKYLLIRLSYMPVCSMLNAMKSHSSTAITEANDEIDSKIQEVQQFLMDYENSLAKL